MNQKLKILNIGTLPLPLGGVTVHLQRLLLELKISEIAKQTKFYDYKRESKIGGLIKILRSDIIHIHLSNKIFRFFLVVFGIFFLKKVIITFHGKYDFHNFFDLFSLKLSNINLVLNEFSYKNALGKVRSKSKVILSSAFIPPSGIQNELSKSNSILLEKFIAKYNNIVCTNAHSYVLDSKKKDLYGIDFLLNVFKDLPDYGLIIADPSGNLTKKYHKYLHLPNVLFISRPEPFIQILKKSNVFIRATTTDGDSLSVKEALYYKTKVLASDCVNRPKGCTLFRMHDEKSFKSGLKTISEKVNIESEEILNGAVQIIEIYTGLLKDD